MGAGKNFARNLYRLRKQRGVSQAKLARQVDWYDSRISELENDRRRFDDLDFAYAIAKALGVTLDEMCQPPPRGWRRPPPKKKRKPPKKRL